MIQTGWFIKINEQVEPEDSLVVVFFQRYSDGLGLAAGIRWGNLFFCSSNFSTSIQYHF